MNKKHLNLLNFLRNKQAPLKERLSVADQIKNEVLRKNIPKEDIRRIYRVMVQFWKSLGTLVSDRFDESLFLTRIRLGMSCKHVSRFLPEGQRFFSNYPKIELAEGPNRFKGNQKIRGRISSRLFSSVFEFHWEYPIEGCGVRKDQISVITDSGAKISLFDWCEAKEIIVFCTRCGLDITFEVSKNCPHRRIRPVS